jgi:hypothetical protein
MNLHAVAGPCVGAINPNVIVEVYASAGSVVNADGVRVPVYDPPYKARAQVQALTFGDLRQIEGLNIQGIRRAMYFLGNVDGVVRPLQKGGDLVKFAGQIWLVAWQLESWNPQSGWVKVCLTLQTDMNESFVPPLLQPSAPL